MIDDPSGTSRTPNASSGHADFVRVAQPVQGTHIQLSRPMVIVASIDLGYTFKLFLEDSKLLLRNSLLFMHSLK